MREWVGGAFWSLAYTALLALPLIVLGSGLVGLSGSGWWFDFSMGLGFGAVALFGGQFLLTARFRRATAPFGMDVLYVFHRWLAVIALVLVLAHYGILRVSYPATLEPFWPATAPWYMTAGRASLAVFLLLVVSSLARKALRIEYDDWRLAHTVLAVLGMALAVIHVLGVGYYSGVFWTRIVLDLFLASVLALVAYVRVMKPVSLMTKPYRVSDVRAEGGDTWMLTMEPEGHSGLRFAPGQFGWLSLGCSPLRAREHPFSFSGSAEQDGTLEFTIKELGDFTRTVGRTEIGTVAYVDGPHGVFTVDRYPEAPGFLFLAGGVGIAPIASILRTLADRGDARPLCLVYGSSSWERTVLKEELARLSERLNLEVIHVLEELHEGWKGAVGRPTPELLQQALAGLPEGMRCFMCGPEPMTKMAEAALRARGVPLRRIHSELFDMA
ncbi:MAG: ferric reductase-like transmembrane domain-containing protein [Gemmatimonadota bacterium]|nr:ferric reductase-like transmembrane domain-containing protein [Gemmatimonadota bacterium]